MIKKFLLGSFMLLSLHSFAQEGTASPYSYYGIGDVKFKGTVDNRAMGGISVLSDSIHLNLQNPASLSVLKLTSFALGGTYNTLSLKSATSSEKARRTTLDYLAVAFPVGKLGFSFGLIPYSSVGYKVEKISTNDTEVSSKYSGNGGLNKVYVAGAYQINSKLSAGIDIAYNFGEIETNSAVFLPGIVKGSRELNTSDLSGMTVNAGLIFRSKIKKYDFISSLTISPTTNLKSKNVRNTAVITYNSTGLETVWDSKDVPVADSKLKMPTKYTLGAGFGDSKKWFVGVESTLQQSSTFGNLYNDITKVNYENASKFAVGGYFVPKFNSFSNYFDRVTYRGGLRYENTGLVINGQSIKDKAVTLGFGFPVGGNLSNINVGLEFGKKGTTAANLIQENYTNVSIGLSFNDRWFMKRKFD